MSKVCLLVVSIGLCLVSCTTATSIPQREQQVLGKDAEIAREVSEALRGTARESEESLRIHVRDEVVILNGQVPSLGSRRRAALRAMSVRPVIGVVNLLQVAPSTVAEDEILRQVELALLRQAAIESYQVKPTVRGSLVILRGRAETDADKVLSAQAVETVPGVQRIENRILVSSAAKDEPPNRRPTRISDSVLEQRVRQVLDVDPRLGQTAITVHVRSGRVTLNGTVVDPSVRAIAEEDALNTVGVSEVENQIRVLESERLSFR